MADDVSPDMEEPFKKMLDASRTILGIVDGVVDEDIRPIEEEVDVRLLDAFTLHTNFHEIFSLGYQNAIAIAAGPAADVEWEGHVFRTVKDTWMAMHDRINPHERRLNLAVESLAGDFCRSGLTKLQTANSMQQYATWSARLILYCLRLPDFLDFQQLQPGQAEMSIALKNDATAGRPLGSKAIIDLMFAIFSEQVPLERPRTDLVVFRFVNAAAVKNSCSLLDCSDMTRLLSMLIYGARLVILERARSTLRVEHPDATQEVLKLAQASSYSPVWVMWDLKRLAKSCLESAPARARIHWRHDGEPVPTYRSMLIDHIRLDIVDITACVNSLLKDAQELLTELTFGICDLLVDNRSCTALDAIVDDSRISFLDSDANGFSKEENKLRLFNHVCRDPALRDKFICLSSSAEVDSDATDRSGLWTWSTAAAKEYAAKTSRLNLTLLVLYHLISGQPARATEITTLNIRDGRGGVGSKSLFANPANNMLYTVQTYSKTRKSKGLTNSFIPRFIPKEVVRVLRRWMLTVTKYLPFTCR